MQNQGYNQMQYRNRFPPQQGFQGYPQGYPQGYGATPQPLQKKKPQKRPGEKDEQTKDGVDKKHVHFVKRGKGRDESPSSDNDTGSKHIFLRLKKTDTNRVNYEIIYSDLICKQITRNEDVVTIVLDKSPLNVRTSQTGVGVQVEDAQIKLTLKPQSSDESVAVIVT